MALTVSSNTISRFSSCSDRTSVNSIWDITWYQYKPCLFFSLRWYNFRTGLSGWITSKFETLWQSLAKNDTVSNIWQKILNKNTWYTINWFRIWENMDVILGEIKLFFFSLFQTWLQRTCQPLWREMFRWRLIPQ